MNRLHEIEALGTAVWIDNLTRELLEEGRLERLIEENGVTGVTSNPTIFNKAVEDSDRYDRLLREAIAETREPRQVYFRVAFADTREACDLLRPVFERSEALRARGARVQRPLWGWASTKNPDCTDTLYVDELTGPHTVKTMPDAT